MKYLLLDRIDCLEPGSRITTHKNLSLAEEYLGDHFPTFPVLPGVLMLEAMTQSAAWLVRLEQDYAHSIVVLKSARNVRYNYFLQPGNTLRCEVEVVSTGADSTKFKGVGYVGDRLAVSAKLELAWYSLAEKGPWGKDADCRIVAQIKQYFDLMGGPQALQAAGQPENA
jgi:3-hydroxyacyl-[acyl-carrier-protein] dehydratase